MCVTLFMDGISYAKTSLSLSLYVTGFAKTQHVVSCVQLYLQAFYYLQWRI